MKKIIVFLVTFLFIGTVNAEEKPRLYLFVSDTCGYCSIAVDSITESYEEYSDVFDVVLINIAEAENISLYYQTADLFSASYAVPLIVVGNEHSVGYSDAVIEMAINAASDEEYEDVIRSFISNSANVYNFNYLGKGNIEVGNTSTEEDLNDEDVFASDEEDKNNEDKNEDDKNDGDVHDVVEENVESNKYIVYGSIIILILILCYLKFNIKSFRE